MSNLAMLIKPKTKLSSFLYWGHSCHVKHLTPVQQRHNFLGLTCRVAERELVSTSVQTNIHFRPNRMSNIFYLLTKLTKSNSMWQTLGQFEMCFEASYLKEPVKRNLKFSLKTENILLKHAFRVRKTSTT